MDLSQFLEKIDREEKTTYPIKFTWLIGAGFSESAGIPMAIEVSHILALYEYIGRKKKDEFRDKLSGFGYDQTQLKTYIEWYYDLKKNQPEQYKSLIDETYSWLNTIEEFKNIKKDSSECYQKLFQHLLYDQSDHHYFLTSIIQRNSGINVAHIGLAGLLRDYPKWGHTVFTTNFDDLLLRATLALNHTIRIFGEIKSNELPDLHPSYPQIVHLHGRHTGYNLLNTKSQINSWYLPELKSAFRNHIENSNLIIIGYSGWDDLVMRTLSDWDSDTLHLIKGNLYWIPHKSEETIDEKVRAFLNKCPELKTFVITNSTKNLNADSFILAFLDVVNKHKGSFGAYRRDLLEKAKEQHSFIMKQLKEYPDDNPEEKVHKLANNAKSFINSNQFNEAAIQIRAILNIISQPDIQIEIKATWGKESGLLFARIGNTKDAIDCLKLSLEYFNSIPNISLDLKMSMNSNQCLLAELLMSVDSFDAGYEFAKRCIFSATEILKLKDCEEVKINLIKAKICRIYCSIMAGIYGLVDRDFQDIASQINLIENKPKIIGKYYQLKAMMLVHKLDFDKADNFFDLSSTFYDKTTDKKNILLNRIYKLCIRLHERKLLGINQEIEYIKDEFIAMNDYDGVSIIANVVGYMSSINDEPDDELIEMCFSTSISHFEKTGMVYNLLNVLIDNYNYLLFKNDFGGAQLLRERINHLDTKNSKYFKEAVK